MHAGLQRRAASAGQSLQQYLSSEPGAVVDGYFTARGRSRDVDDLVPSTASEAAEDADHRRRGADMSADEIVDFVLDELASREPVASWG